MTEFLSGEKSSTDTVINVATSNSSPLFTPGGWLYLFVIHLHVKGRFPVIINKSRLGMQFLNSISFTQPSAGSVIAAVREDS